MESHYPLFTDKYLVFLAGNVGHADEVPPNERQPFWHSTANTYQLYSVF